MITLRHTVDIIIDSTGPLRRNRLPAERYVVGEHMLIAVDSGEEAYSACFPICIKLRVFPGRASRRHVLCNPFRVEMLAALDTPGWRYR